MMIIFILSLIVLILLLLLLYVIKKLFSLHRQFTQLQFTHRSQNVKHGQHWEQFVPFMDSFAAVANKDNFVFIGQPIDGICFDDDAIKFIEIKTGKGTFNKKQIQVKDHIEQKRIKWIELRH